MNSLPGTAKGHGSPPRTSWVRSRRPARIPCSILHRPARHNRKTSLPPCNAGARDFGSGIPPPIWLKPGQDNSKQHSSRTPRRSTLPPNRPLLRLCNSKGIPPSPRLPGSSCSRYWTLRPRNRHTPRSSTSPRSPGPSGRWIRYRPRKRGGCRPRPCRRAYPTSRSSCPTSGNTATSSRQTLRRPGCGPSRSA